MSIDEIEARSERRGLAIDAIPIEKLRGRRRIVDEEELARRRFAVVENHEWIVEDVARPHGCEVGARRRVVNAFDARIRTDEGLLVENVRTGLKRAEAHQDACEDARLVTASAFLQLPTRNGERRVRPAVGHQTLEDALRI